jgi:hypothetical protein
VLVYTRGDLEYVRTLSSGHRNPRSKPTCGGTVLAFSEIAGDQSIPVWQSWSTDLGLPSVIDRPLSDVRLLSVRKEASSSVVYSVPSDRCKQFASLDMQLLRQTRHELMPILMKVDDGQRTSRSTYIEINVHRDQRTSRSTYIEINVHRDQRTSRSTYIGDQRAFDYAFRTLPMLGRSIAKVPMTAAKQMHVTLHAETTKAQQLDT